VLANGLLVLGLTIIIGARRSPDGVMRFNPRLILGTVAFFE
jgi:hypothetical protein